MNLVLISDTHGHHKKFDIPDGDVLVFAGDMMTAGWDHFEIISFNKWLGRLPHPHKIVIAGNHDRLFETNPTYCQTLLSNAIYLKNSGREIDGVKFWGSPYTPAFCDWAFNLRPDQLQDNWVQIPDNTDVLITHGPPYGILDKAHPKHDHLGDRVLLEAVQRVNPKVHVFGHIHGGYGRGSWGILGAPTQHVNASLVNEAYAPVNKPIVVEL